MKLGPSLLVFLLSMSATHASAGAEPLPPGASAPATPSAPTSPGAPAVRGARAALPLELVREVALPGRSVRFDYQDIDFAKRQLVIAHMSDASVVVVKLSDGSVLQVIKNIPTARGVAVADEVGKIFITSSPRQLVILDNSTLAEVARVKTGRAPDGVAWDPRHRVVGVSDQGDGAISLLEGAGLGARTQLRLGSETGNVVYDAARGRFWITVGGPAAPDQLVAIDPAAHQVVERIALPGCKGAHGLRIHPDGKSAFIACEENDLLARVDLDGAHGISMGPTGSGPDVLSIDPGLGWLYVAAESGDLTVFDIQRPGVFLIGHDHPGQHAHTVVVDPETHRVFFPLLAGLKGTPVLRIFRPTGLAPLP
jgi:DNA-binding beta-propeller fold protein YncE